MTSSPLDGTRGPEGFRRTLRRDLWFCLVVAAVAAAVRVVYLVQLHGTPFPHQLIMDAATYDAWARDIAAGNWLGDRIFYQEPLYPYLLAVIHTVFGEGLAAVYVLQALAGVANCVLLTVLTSRVLDSRWAGLIAGLALALYRPMVFYEAQVLKPVWAVLVLLVLMHVLLSAWERRSLVLWTLAGVLLALLGLLRGNALLYVPFVLVWALVAGRHWKRAVLAASLALMLAGLAIPLGAVMLRNYAVGGEPVLSSSHAGFNFYIGNHEGADGTYQFVPGVREDPQYEGEDARALASRRVGSDLTLARASSYWFKQAAEFIRRDPLAWLRLEAVKLGRFLNAEGVQDTWSPDFLAEHAPALRLALVTYGMLVPPALVGLVVLFRRGIRVHLVSLLVLATALSVVIFYVFDRYRLPVVPLFALLGAGVVVRFAAWLRAGRYAGPLAAVLGAALATCVVLIDIPNRAADEEYRASLHHNLGIVYERAREPEKAKAEYNRALTAWPRYARSMTALANIHLKEGKTTSARGLLHEAIAADRLDADAHYLLAGVYHREGKTLNAIVELEKAIDARPGFLAARRDLGAVLIINGDFRRAARVLEAASRMDPRSEIIWKNLGTCYYQLRDLARARECWVRALGLASSAEEKRSIRANLSLLPPVKTP